MSSTRNTVLFLLSSVALAGGAGLAVTACSSSSTSDGSGTDSGAAETSTPKPRTDSGTVDQDSGSTDPQACYKACLDAHPTAKAAYTAVDTCWANKCNDPCLQQSGSFDAGAKDAGDAGADAGDGGDAGDGLCGTTTGSGGDLACDQCTETFCCTEWATCYTTNHDECAAIDDCLGQCP